MSEQQPGPVLRVVNPDATPEEVAAVVAVLSALGGGAGTGSPSSGVVGPAPPGTPHPAARSGRMARKWPPSLTTSTSIASQELLRKS